MKKLLSTLLLAGFAPAAAFADVTKEEIQRLLAAGVSDEVVLSYIRQHGPVDRLSADDLVDLKAAGAGDQVLSALLSNQAVPDADLPYRSVAPVTPSGGVFGTVYVYDSMWRSYLPVRSRPAEPLCTWGPTFTTVESCCVAPLISCRPFVPVCRPVVRTCGRTRR